MFSVDSFYKWTNQTYLEDRYYDMITYLPHGTREYKNLDLYEYHQQRKENGYHYSFVLLNDQEPVSYDAICAWKEQYIKYYNNSIYPKGTQSRIDAVTSLWGHYIVGYKKLDKIAPTNEYESTDVDMLQYFLNLTTDKTFASRIALGGIYKPIIVHSELNSADINELSDEFIPVYVFYHGLISRDWYRHIKHESKPSIEKAINPKRFLLYARSWTGSREYRLKFIEKIVQEDIHHCIKHNFHCTDNEHDYHTFVPENLKWIVRNKELENYFPEEQIDSHASANINLDDFNTTGISIVCETVFDSSKVHLTEKTFQPIAVGNPFIMLSGAYSLRTLRRYGFKTFNDCWDESYDKILDSEERMDAVLKIVKYIAGLTRTEYASLYEKCIAICEHNQKHFFSDEFENYILNEYANNFKMAFEAQENDIFSGTWWFVNHLMNNVHKTNKFGEHDAAWANDILNKLKERDPKRFKNTLTNYPFLTASNLNIRS
jgi:hypothetical protein